jgi:hypothetical protein
MLRTYLVLGVGELEVMVLVLLLMDQSGSSTRGPEEAVAGFMLLPSGLELAQHSGLGTEVVRKQYRQ